MIEGEHYDYKFVHTGLQPTCLFQMVYPVLCRHLDQIQHTAGIETGNKNQYRRQPDDEELSSLQVD